MEDNTLAALWLSQMRRLQARERLDAHEDINAAILPQKNKELLLYLTQCGYGDDEAQYAARVHAIASLGNGDIFQH